MCVCGGGVDCFVCFLIVHATLIYGHQALLGVPSSPHNNIAVGVSGGVRRPASGESLTRGLSPINRRACVCEAPIQHWVRTRFVRSQQLCLVLTTPCPPPPTPPPTTHTHTPFTALIMASRWTLCFARDLSAGYPTSHGDSIHVSCVRHTLPPPST